MAAEFFGSLGRSSVQWLWFPSLVWTALAALVLTLMSLARGLHPLIAYRIRQALLFALPLVVVLTPLMPGGASPLAPWVPPMVVTPNRGVVVPDADGSMAGRGILEIALTSRSPEITATPLPAGGALPPRIAARPGLGGPELGSRPSMVEPTATDMSRLPWSAAYLLFGVTALAVVILAGARAVALLHHFRALATLRSGLVSVGDPCALEILEEVAERFGVRRPVLLLEGPPDSVPMTFHTRRPAVVIPRGMFADPARLRIALAHELIHVRRGDFLWGVLERAVEAAFVFHPFVWTLRRSVEQGRESSCDAEVVASGITHPRAYARLLYDMGGRAPIHLGVAAGIATRTSNLKQRLETMKRFTDRPTSRLLRSRSAIAGVGILVATALLGACVGQTAESENEVVADYIAGARLTSEFELHSDGQLRGALDRLEVQLDYLVAEMTALQPNLREARPHIHRRYELLNTLYTERLRMFEVLKMEAVADRALGDR